MASTATSAAVDVGTNSVRLLIVDGEGHTVLRELAITRLGRGVDERGHLDEASLRRTLDVIAGYRDRWREHGADERVRIAATSAVRDAVDRDRFFDGVRRLTGVDAEVLTGEQEAGIAFHGAATSLEAPRPLAVVDVGGGSTELIVGDGGDEVAGAVSLQLGSVRLTERLLPGDPPTDDELARARAEVQDRLEQADRALEPHGADVGAAATLVGVAGTVTTLAALDRDLDAWVDGAVHAHRLPLDAIRDLTARLAAMPAAARAELGPMQPGREDVIVGGALIVEGVLERYGFDEVVVSEADILDGLALTAATGRPRGAGGA